MSQQGETDPRQEDEWWRQLYGEPDAGDLTAPEPDDTVDDRYTSALTTLGAELPVASPPAADDPRPPDTLRLRRVSPSGPVDVPPQREEDADPGGPEARGGMVEQPGASSEPERSGPRGAGAAQSAVWVPAQVGDLGGASPTFIGDRPPTYDPEPTAWPAADPEDLDDLVPDTVLDGARYGVLTLRTASVRGDSARYRGQPRRDVLLTARFGAGDDALLLVMVAGGARAAEDAHRVARDACRWIAGAVGRSHPRLAEDIRAARRGSLKSGLQRLTDRCYGRLRARSQDLGLDPAEYNISLRCLLLPVDPACRIRLFFGVGEGGLFRIRDGDWQDLDQQWDESAKPQEPQDGPVVRFRFRACVARPGDTLLLCSGGFAEPLRDEPALVARLAERWGTGHPPGLAAFLGDTQTRVKGYADDRTAVAVWDA